MSFGSACRTEGLGKLQPCRGASGPMPGADLVGAPIKITQIAFVVGAGRPAPRKKRVKAYKIVR